MHILVRDIGLRVRLYIAPRGRIFDVVYLSICAFWNRATSNSRERVGSCAAQYSGNLTWGVLPLSIFSLRRCQEFARFSW